MGENLNKLVHPYHSSKKEQTIDTHNLDLQKIMLSKKKPVPKVYILYTSIYIKFLKWQDPKNGEQINSC